jgi:hypothetical protein
MHRRLFVTASLIVVGVARSRDIQGLERRGEGLGVDCASLIGQKLQNAE